MELIKNWDACVSRQEIAYFKRPVSNGLNITEVQNKLGILRMQKIQGSIILCLFSITALIYRAKDD